MQLSGCPHSASSCRIWEGVLQLLMKHGQVDRAKAIDRLQAAAVRLNLPPSAVARSILQSEAPRRPRRIAIRGERGRAFAEAQDAFTQLERIFQCESALYGRYTRDLAHAIELHSLQREWGVAMSNLRSAMERHSLACDSAGKAHPRVPELVG